MSAPTQRGLRLIAAFEAAKGLLVLLAGFGLLSLLHRDIQQIAEDVVSHFHLNPASHYPRIFLQLAENLTDTKLWLMTGFSLAYSSLRLAEAYGLWWGLRWAEWLAVLSSGIYIPIEVYELFSGFSWIKTCTLIANICIVIYIAYVLKNN